MKTRTIVALIALSATALLTGCATTGAPTVTQQWAYNQPVVAGPNDAGGSTPSRNTLTLWRAQGAATGTMKVAGQVTDACLAGTLDVAIEETVDTLVLLPGKTMATCYDTRISIRKNGSGGFVERRGYKTASFAVAWQGFDWGLQPK